MWIDSQVRRDGRADAAMNLGHHVVDAIFRFDELAQATARTRESLQEARVHGLVDTEGEDPHVAQARRDFTQDVILVADLTVRDEHDNAFAVVLATDERFHGELKRMRELRPTARFDLRDVFHGFEPRAIGRV
jgi:hypothetical protein